LLYDLSVRKLAAIVLVGLLITFPCDAFGEDIHQSPILRLTKMHKLPSLLPKGTHFLHDPVTIEKFLEKLDGAPPDWAEIHGKHGDSPDERLFALNRERDQLRAGRPALAERITFVWDGVLSHYLSDKAGFLVAIGPEVITTRWGQIRFKPESLPTELVAMPMEDLKESLRGRISRGETVKVVVAMTGRFLQEEAVIYDFAHEEPGQGMIMPMVRVERIDYFLIQ
jgi:hypothetical protein